MVTGTDGILPYVALGGISHTGPHHAPRRGATRSTNGFESVLVTGPIHNAAPEAPEAQTTGSMMESTLLYIFDLLKWYDRK